MSQMSNQAVLTCSRCARPVVLTSLITATPDYDGELLQRLMKMFSQSALCPRCQGGLNYYASQGRGDDWQKGRP